jgi:hypothetical protein
MSWCSCQSGSILLTNFVPSLPEFYHACQECSVAYTDKKVHSNETHILKMHSPLLISTLLLQSKSHCWYYTSQSRILLWPYISLNICQRTYGLHRQAGGVGNMHGIHKYCNQMIHQWVGTALDSRPPWYWLCAV